VKVANREWLGYVLAGADQVGDPQRAAGLVSPANVVPWSMNGRRRHHTTDPLAVR